MADIIRPIEPFELTQGFGGNKQAYARFGLEGHNGWDFRTKFDDTPKGFRHILTSWHSTFYSHGNEGKDGFGVYFEVIVQLKNTYKLTYAHCNSFNIFQTKNEGEVMGISDNTGNSTGSHLHLTVKRGHLNNGKFVSDNYSNGYFGAINPQEFFDELREFKKTGTLPKLPEVPPVQEKSETTVNDMQPKRQIIKDVYQALKGKDPTDDELVWREQQSLNTRDLIIDMLRNDGEVRELWGLNSNAELQEKVEKMANTLTTIQSLASIAV